MLPKLKEHCLLIDENQFPVQFCTFTILSLHHHNYKNYISFLLPPLGKLLGTKSFWVKAATIIIKVDFG